MRSEDVARAVALNYDGRDIRYIANVLGRARSTIHDAISRFRQTGEYVRRPGSGRARVTNQRDDHFIALTALRHRAVTLVVDLKLYGVQECLYERSAVDYMNRD